MAKQFMLVFLAIVALTVSHLADAACNAGNKDHCLDLFEQNDHDCRKMKELGCGGYCACQNPGRRNAVCVDYGPDFTPPAGKTMTLGTCEDCGELKNYQDKHSQYKH